MQVKADKPDLAFGEVGKEIGARWKEISEKDKKKYEEKASKDKERCKFYLYLQDVLLIWTSPRSQVDKRKYHLILSLLKYSIHSRALCRASL